MSVDKISEYWKCVADTALNFDISHNSDVHFYGSVGLVDRREEAVTSVADTFGMRVYTQHQKNRRKEYGASIQDTEKGLDFLDSIGSQLHFNSSRANILREFWEQRYERKQEWEFGPNVEFDEERFEVESELFTEMREAKQRLVKAPTVLTSSKTAAILDYNGGILIQKRPKGGNKDEYVLYVKVGSKHPGLGESFRQRYGGSVGEYSKETRVNTTISYRATGGIAKNILVDARPYLVLRQPLADMAIEFQENQEKLNQETQGMSNQFVQRADLVSNNRVREEFYQMMLTKREELGETVRVKR